MKTCPNCRAVYPNHFAVCPRDAVALVETEDWSDGTIIRGKYRILGKVGQGGMGAVFKALHTKFNYVRALKVMSTELAADPDFVKRFEREAVVMSKLQHPNVVRVDDIDESEDGRPFIVMEFVEGRSLRQVIRQEGPLPSLRVCSIIKQATAGLGAAHALGMVHRDVKPDNIVLIGTAGGEHVKVLDFGIAKLKEAQLGDGLRTATGVIIGTPQYLSPEQALGKRSEELDGRSDLYSLGLVMYQMLTQDLPFQADSAVGWMLARLNEPPRPIHAARPDLAIPDALANLVMRCLEKDRDLRPADAAELIREIEAVEDGIRHSSQTVAPSVPTVSSKFSTSTIPLTTPKPLRHDAPRAVATSRWAQGWKLWAGIVVLVLIPFVLGPLYDATPYAYPPMRFPALFAAIIVLIGITGWMLLTRRHWGFRVPGALLVTLFTLMMAGRVYNIYSYMPPWGLDERLGYKASPIEELKHDNLCPIGTPPATRGVDSQGQIIFSQTFQNLASDARVTDWKANTIHFDVSGNVISDSPVVNRMPIAIEPGKTVQMQLTGGDMSKVRSVKMVFQEVEYEVVGTKQPGKWINADFAGELQKAKQH